MARLPCDSGAWKTTSFEAAVPSDDWLDQRPSRGLVRDCSQFGGYCWCRRFAGYNRGHDYKSSAPSESESDFSGAGRKIPSLTSRRAHGQSALSYVSRSTILESFWSEATTAS